MMHKNLGELLKLKKAKIFEAAAILLLAVLLGTLAVAIDGGTQIAAFASAQTAAQTTITPTNYPAYVLGSSNISSVINSSLQIGTSNITPISDVAILSSIKAGDGVLFVDGQWLQTTSFSIVATEIQPLILEGIPVIVIANSPELLKTATAGFNISQVYPTNVPLIACGLKYYPQTGQSIGLAISGSPTNSSQISKATTGAYQWSSQFLTNTVPQQMANQVSPMDNAPYWWMGFELYYYSYDEFAPYGELNFFNQYYILENSGWPNYNFYSCHYDFESVPGDESFGNNELTEWMANEYEANYVTGHSADLLIGASPTSNSGGSQTVSVSLSAEGPALAWQYNIPDVTESWMGDLSEQMAAWAHQVNIGNCGSAENTFDVNPGWTTQVPSSEKYGSVYDIYEIGWGHWNWYIPGIWGYWVEDYQATVTCYGLIFN